MEFWEISGRKEDENRGFSVPCGITPRCAEWETGMQNDRERGRQTAALLLHLESIRCERLAVVLYCRKQKKILFVLLPV